MSDVGSNTFVGAARTQAKDKVVGSRNCVYPHA